MKLLFASAEVFPMAKTGGLGDVGAALPAALADLGIDVRIVMPAYRSALEAAGPETARIDLGRFEALGAATASVRTTPDSGLPLYLIENRRLFDRPGGPHGDPEGSDWPDNALRFGMLSRAAARLALGADPTWRPDIVHANDWHTGVLVAALAFAPAPRPATVFTIHNMAFQGIFGPEVFPLLGLPLTAFSIDGIEYYNGVSFLKAGIAYADRVTTVSPSYAREIQTAQFGFGLEGVIANRRDAVSGILNGVDYRVWDPSRDPYLERRYDADDLSGKAACKAALQRELGLEVKPEAPLVGVVARLTWQKGLDLALEAMPAVVGQGVQLALLGAGERSLERGFRELAQAHPGRVAVRMGYDEPLSHRIEAGADVFLMPSRFEPCGLNQMYSLRYGSVPVVRGVGGLRDTVVDAGTNGSAPNGTGFVFADADAASLTAALRRALTQLPHAARWRALQRRGMALDFGWPRAAAQYADLYRSISPAEATA